MKHRSPHPTREILSDVRSQFERWRRSRPRGTRIPAARQLRIRRTAISGVMPWLPLRIRCIVKCFPSPK